MKIRKKKLRKPFQIVQPSSTEKARLGERHTDRTDGKSVVDVPSIEQHSIRVPSPAQEGKADLMTLRDWTNFIRALASRQDGQTMAEYGVVLAVITGAVVLAIGALAAAITGKLGNVTSILGG
jgi:Flp pilus assembly pilin Flp